MKKIKCPKCKGIVDKYIELWIDHSIEYDADNNGLPKRDNKDIFLSPIGNLHPGRPYRVEAKCENCGYQWKIRKATQITDLLE